MKISVGFRSNYKIYHSVKCCISFVLYLENKCGMQLVSHQMAENILLAFQLEVQSTIYLRLLFLAELLLTALLFGSKNLIISSKNSDIPVFVLINTGAT